MSEKAPNQASSKEDLHPLSALEESMAPFGMGDLDTEHGVILKDWSAQDFANIYVRFRPHLISHASRFLREETQAEEVVQDAFLYLMTALPELDSELGVLRFLKWKTKMLCLDIIRSSQVGLNKNLVPLPDDVADESQILDSLERADDAAIIRLALAKLQPRHREALIATIYEEKSHQEVARQMDVGENALRQLLFRARASFRQALVGEAEIEGKTIAEILTVAAQRSAVARNNVVVALLVMTAVTVSSVLGLNLQFAEPPVADGPRLVETNPVKPEVQFPDKSDSEAVASAGASSEIEEKFAVVSPINSAYTAEQADGQSASNSSVEVINQTVEPDSQLLAEAAFANELGEGFLSSFATQAFEMIESNGAIALASQDGIAIYFGIDLESESVVQLFSVEIRDGGKVWKAVPKSFLSVVEEIDGNVHLSYAATDFLVGDFSGEFDFVSTADSIFSKSGLRVDFVITKSGEFLESSISTFPKL